VEFEHHAIGRGTVGFPDRPAVEAAEPAPAGLHALEGANPDETVRLPHHRELPENEHPLFPLREEEVFLEEPDELAGGPFLEKIVPQLDNSHRQESGPGWEGPQ
jgi:hypothetical protein